MSESRSGETSSSRHRLPHQYAEQEFPGNRVPTAQSVRPEILGQKQVGKSAVARADTRPKTTRSRTTRNRGQR
jgi:hypothetical protein